MHQNARVTILGATGMVGFEALHICLDEPRVREVACIGRRPTGVAHPKLREVMHADFTDQSALADALRDTDVILYCVGVYTGQVPEAEFFKVTCDYFAELLRVLATINSKATFCLFSAEGADPTERTRMMFGEAKGRAERMLTESALPAKYIFRPGYIAPGRRKSRSRIPDWLALPVYKLIPAIGVSAHDLAKVMVYTGLDAPDRTLFGNGDIRRAAAAMLRR